MGRKNREGQPSSSSGPRALLKTWLRLCVENPRLTFFLRARHEPVPTALLQLFADVLLVTVRPAAA